MGLGTARSGVGAGPCHLEQSGRNEPVPLLMGRCEPSRGSAFLRRAPWACGGASARR